MADDPLPVLNKVTRLLDPISPEQRETVFAFLHDRYQIRVTAGATRKARSRERLRELDKIGTNMGRNLDLNGTTAPPTRVFEVPVSIREALLKAKRLGTAARLKESDFWQAEVRANPGVNFAAEIFKAESWMCANPERAPRKNYGSFLHRWLSRAERTEESPS